MERERAVNDLRTLRLLAVAVLVGGAALAVTGVPDLPVMWPLYQLGFVLPSCGLTRGVAEIFRGNVARAWRFNPASFVVVGGAALLLTRGMSNSAFTMPAIDSVRIRRIGAIALGVAVLALWVNQQLHADFVMNARV